MAACVFTDTQEIEAAAAKMGSIKRRFGRSERWEFKYAKSPMPEKDALFEALGSIEFVVRAVILSKGPTFREADPRGLALAQLFLRESGFIGNAKVVIDGKNSKVFDIESAGRLRKQINAQAPGTIDKVTFADSSRNSMVQLADMVAGAIRRSQYAGEAAARRHVRAISGQVAAAGGGIWAL